MNPVRGHCKCVKKIRATDAQEARRPGDVVVGAEGVMGVNRPCAQSCVALFRFRDYFDFHWGGNHTGID